MDAFAVEDVKYQSQEQTSTVWPNRCWLCMEMELMTVWRYTWAYYLDFFIWSYTIILMTVLNYNYELKVMTALGLMFVMLYSSNWIQTSIIMKLGTIRNQPLLYSFAKYCICCNTWYTVKVVIYTWEKFTLVLW